MNILTPDKPSYESRSPRRAIRSPGMDEYEPRSAGRELCIGRGPDAARA